MFSLWGSVGYNYEDQSFGLNGKLSYQIESFMALSTQMTLFSKSGEGGYTELRNETGFYFSLAPNQKFCPILFAGASKGAWQRNWEEPYAPNFDVITIDSSPVFGLGFTYHMGRFRYYGEHKIYPDIWQSNTTLGIQLRVFKPTKGRKIGGFLL